MEFSFLLYPLLLAATLGLWWLPFFLWKEDEKIKKVAGILLWWVNIPLYCLMLGPALEKGQPHIPEHIHVYTKWIGLLLFGWGILATLLFLVPRWRAGGPGYDATKLQVKGIFAIVRHPQLSSAWFISAGWSLFHGALYALFTSFLFLPVLWIHAYMEEKYLLIPVFGDKYLEYRRKVKAFIPFVI